MFIKSLLHNCIEEDGFQHFFPFKMNEKQARYQQALEAKQTACLQMIKEKEKQVSEFQFTRNALQMQLFSAPVMQKEARSKLVPKDPTML